jgi:hypothetical protein
VLKRFTLQAAVVQLSCMAYEFLLLQRCNVAHMRMFSVFLALPSATVRVIATSTIVILACQQKLPCAVLLEISLQMQDEASVELHKIQD